MSEVGVMWSVINEFDYILLEVIFFMVELLWDVIYEGFIYVLGNLFCIKCYGV